MYCTTQYDSEVLSMRPSGIDNICLSIGQSTVGHSMCAMYEFRAAAVLQKEMFFPLVYSATFVCVCAAVRCV